MPSVSEKVDILESALAEYIRKIGDAQMQTEKSLTNLSNAQMQTEKELRNLSIQTEKFIEETRADRESFKNELREDRENFKKDMREDRESFKKEMLEDRKKMFKQWGEIANKMGTLAEDIVAPCVREIGQKYFGCDEDSDEDFMVRRFRRKTKDKGQRREFDVIAVYEDKVILVEVKSTPRMQYIDEFVATLKEFREYFPEYLNRKVIPVFASLYLPDEVIAYLTKHGIYAMATRDDMMDLMNFGEMKLVG